MGLGFNQNSGLRPQTNQGLQKTPEDNNLEELKKLEEVRVKYFLELVKKINESNEFIDFPGINQEIYLKMKKDEEEYPGYTTPIDTIKEAMQKDGIKIVLGNHPESGNVFVLPKSSNNIEEDSIALNQLEVVAISDI